MSRSWRTSHPKGQDHKIKRLGKKRRRMLDRISAANGDAEVSDKGIVNQDIWKGFIGLDLERFPHSRSK